MDKKGFIYVMTNPSMPGLLKVGMTKKVPTLRALDKDLNTTGVPTLFQTQYYAFFDNMIFAEQQAHRKLQQFHHGKEFFKTDVATAICAIESINIPFTKLYSKPEDDTKAAKIRQEQQAARKRQEAEREGIEADRIKQEAERKRHSEGVDNISFGGACFTVSGIEYKGNTIGYDKIKMVHYFNLTRHLMSQDFLIKIKLWNGKSVKLFERVDFRLAVLRIPITKIFSSTARKNKNQKIFNEVEETQTRFTYSLYFIKTLSNIEPKEKLPVL